MKRRKGIILAGGSGTRLYPLTIGVSKQLLPVYDKPMIYYPLTVLMLTGIKDVQIITTPEDQNQFQRVLGDGSQWGMNLCYKVQQKPDGLAQAFILAEEFLDLSPSALILGDNIFFGDQLPKNLSIANERASGATVFGYQVRNPERYGVLGFDSNGIVNSIEEKPKNPASRYAITGLYFLDQTAPDRAKKIMPSKRGELEITTLLETYLNDGTLTVERMGRGLAWFDTGTHRSLLDAGNFVRTLIERQGLQIGSPEEIAYRLNWISSKDLEMSATYFGKNNYGTYLRNLANSGDDK